MHNVKWKEFELELQELLKKHEIDKWCLTTDFQLAAHLKSTLTNTIYLIQNREEWHGRSLPYRMDDGYRWYAGNDDEVFQVGPCESRQEAFDEAKGMDWEIIYLVNATKVEMTAPMLDDFAERILEDVIESNMEAWGEDGCDDGWTPEQHAQLAGMLRQVLATFLERNPLKTWTFAHQRWAETWVITDESKAEINAAWEQYTEAFRTDSATAKLPERIVAKYEKVKKDGQ